MKKLIENIYLPFLISGFCNNTFAMAPSAHRQTFKDVHTILGSAATIANEFKLQYEITLEQCPAQPDPSQCQTQQGLYLLADDYPRYLATPWGAVTVNKDMQGYSRQNGVRATVALLAHLKFLFVDLIPVNKKTACSVCEVLPSSLDAPKLRVRPLDLKDLQAAYDTPKIIYANAAASIYAITGVGNTASPTPTPLERNKFRPKKGVVAEWEKLTKECAAS